MRHPNMGSGVRTPIATMLAAAIVVSCSVDYKKRPDVDSGAPEVDARASVDVAPLPVAGIGGNAAGTDGVGGTVGTGGMAGVSVEPVAGTMGAAGAAGMPGVAGMGVAGMGVAGMAGAPVAGAAAGAGGSMPPVGGMGGTGGVTPPPAGTGGSSPPRPTGFDFEVDEQGWIDLMGQGAVVRRSTAQRQSGEAALAIEINNVGSGSDDASNQRYIGVPSTKAPALRPGQVLKYRVWIPAGATQLQAIQPFVVAMDGHWVGAYRLASTMPGNAWTEFTVTLPTPYRTDIIEWMGVQVVTKAGGWQGTVYVDNVTF